MKETKELGELSETDQAGGDGIDNSRHMLA